jgi:hypothetical protein
MGNKEINTTDICSKCKLSVEGFCLGEGNRAFYKEMWKKHSDNFPEAAKELQKEDKKKRSRLQTKAIKRRKEDKSVCSPRCYFAVLLYQTIEYKGKDPYTGWDINWSKADLPGKHNEAPAIDHIDPDCKKPFKNGELNLLFCRSDVNDAKNNLPLDDFVRLCQAVANKSLSRVTSEK